MALPNISIPTPGDLLGQIYDWVGSWLWEPLRAWLNRFYGVLNSQVQQITLLTRILKTVAGRLDNVLSNLPQVVAMALLTGFTIWWKPLLKLIENYIIDNWD